MSEHDEQAALMNYAEWSGYPLNLMFAIPNGGKRHIGTALKLKAEGVKAGVPDIFLPYPVAPYHGLFIEMKTRRGKLSRAQVGFGKMLSTQGYRVLVAYGADHAIDLVQKYVAGKV